MKKRISKIRQEMGEQKWQEYQRQRKNEKALAYKKRNAENVVNWRKNAKIKLIAYKGGKCEICGFNKSIPTCYDFHHKDPKEKDFQIGGKSLAFDKLKKEVDKCMLLCRNCHAELHYKEYEQSRQNSINKLK